MDETLRRQMLLEFGKVAINFRDPAHPDVVVKEVYKVIDAFEKAEKHRDGNIAISLIEGILKQIDGIEESRDIKQLYSLISMTAQIMRNSTTVPQLLGLSVTLQQYMKDQSPASMSPNILEGVRKSCQEAICDLRKFLEEPS